ncbi:MAG: ABC transporter substrate-binding protein [Desulfovibrio sp.]|jgi:branched-chain amino acid transport system substrate-binding protein|nr:ABC transporter substrate-binding protein [Desulfovibrio sp.]
MSIGRAFIHIALAIAATAGLLSVAAPHSVAAQPTEVLIGGVYPLSGPTAPAGKDQREGIEMALDIINGSYDLPLPFAKSQGIPNLGNARLRYIFSDHQGQPEKAFSETERLISVEKVSAIQGAYQSSCAATASQASERLLVPFIADTGTSTTLHRRGFKYFFRIAPHEGQYAENFFNYIKEIDTQRGKRTASVGLVWENTLYGRDVGTEDRKWAEKYGYPVVADISYTDRTTDVTSEVQQIKRANPRIILHGSYVSDALLFLRTYKELEVNPDMIFGHASGFVNEAFVRELGKDADGVLVWEIWSLDLAGKQPLVATVNDLFRKKYGRNMNGHIATAFTAAFVLADAINRAGSTDPVAIEKELRKTSIAGKDTIMPWKGISFDENGENTQSSGLICQIQKGEYRIVWPTAFKAVDVLWPLPRWAER